MNLPKIEVKKINVISKQMKGLRILHLSDLHINKKTNINTLTNLVNMCNETTHHFIVITGDIIDCKAKFIIEKLQILKKLKSKVFYISGNHDLFYGIKDLNKILDNFVFLDNTSTLIPYNKHLINLFGISDRFSYFFGHSREVDKIQEELKYLDNTILLAHQPKDYKIAKDTNTSLFLCGHTHGGQIYPFGYIVRLFQPFLKGIHYINKTAIYVNSGLGNWGINLRFKANNEITILELESKEELENINY